MKTYIKHTFWAVLFGTTVSFTSCSDFLEISPKDQYSEEIVFSDASLTKAFLTNIYTQIQHGAKEHNTTGLTDDAYFTHNYGQLQVNEANVSESDLQWYNDGNCPFRWSDRYKGIRYANLFLSEIDEVPETSGFNKEVMKGEAHFLRAYLYSELVRGYGGVPLVTNVYGLNDVDKMQQPRENIETCLKFIVEDCNAAIDLLPEKVGDSEIGRATRGAAIALKARMLLHVASPLFADRSINTLDVNQFNGNRNELYKEAKEVAKTLINTGTYTLVDCKAESAIQRAEKFRRIILDKKNSEQIFTHQFIVKNGANNLVRQHGPNGYHNWSGTTPTQDLAQAFEYENGKLTEGFVNVGETKTENPYVGREPRFYATIGYDGSEWGRPRPSDALALDPTPLGRLQCGYYELSNVDSEVNLTLPNGSEVKFKGLNGIDTRQGPIEDWNGSWTGYYEKKLVDTAVDGQNYGQDVPWTFIRLAEIYLIAAEACIELGELDEAATYLDAIRNRIGMPDTKTTLTVRGKSFNQADMRDFLRHERRAELAFEDSRYYDVRRWMIAKETNNKKITGVIVYGRLKSGAIQNKPYIHNEEKYHYTYVLRDLSFRENRKWENKMYFAPISRDEIKRNPNMVQNPGMK